MINLLPNISNPISISQPKSLDVKGVDIHTTQITNNLDQKSLNFASNELLVSIILFLTITIFLLFRYEKYKFFFNRLIFIFVLLFFVFYISLFFLSTIEKESNDLFPKLNQGFDEKYSIYSNPDLYKENKEIIINYQNSVFKLYPFSDLNLKNVSSNSIHNDYIYVQILNQGDFNIKFKKNSNFFLDKKVSFSNNRFKNKEVNLIYYLGKNYFTIEKLNRGFKISNNLNKEFLGEIFVLSKSTYKDFLISFIEYLRIIFISIFYIFGTLAFIWHFTKTNIFYKN